MTAYCRGGDGNSIEHSPSSISAGLRCTRTYYRACWFRLKAKGAEVEAGLLVRVSARIADTRLWRNERTSSCMDVCVLETWLNWFNGTPSCLRQDANRRRGGPR